MEKYPEEGGKKKKTLQNRWLAYVLDVRLLSISLFVGGIVAYIVWLLLDKLFGLFITPAAEAAELISTAQSLGEGIGGALQAGVATGAGGGAAGKTYEVLYAEKDDEPPVPEEEGEG